VCVISVRGFAVEASDDSAELALRRRGGAGAV